ncbi:hypothetical protein HKW90_03865 [Pseudomonas aeruginosa]|nr:hypothetical protein [Pseudomonas aeruginosa]
MYAQFQRSGRLPSICRPASPLIALLDTIPPRDRVEIRSVVIGPALGYTGRHAFQNAAQALNWLRPHQGTVSTPSESWKDKRFTHPLTIEDLAKFAQVPNRIMEEWRRRNSPGR